MVKITITKRFNMKPTKENAWWYKTKAWILFFLFRKPCYTTHDIAGNLRHGFGVLDTDGFPQYDIPDKWIEIRNSALWYVCQVFIEELGFRVLPLAVIPFLWSLIFKTMPPLTLLWIVSSLAYGLAHRIGFKWM